MVNLERVCSDLDFHGVRSIILIFVCFDAFN